MQTTIFKLPTNHLDKDRFAGILATLRRGGVMVYPTETYYGLGASCFSAMALQRIYRIKKRDPAKPLSLVAADIAMVKKIIGQPPALFDILTAEYWPGPLTLILPAAAHMPQELLGGSGVGGCGTIGVRVPGHLWLRHLLAAAGFPISATSANISGEKEISDPAEAVRRFSGKVDLIIDGGETPGGFPSTIVDITSTPPQILREGAIASAQIKSFY